MANISLSVREWSFVAAIVVLGIMLLVVLFSKEPVDSQENYDYLDATIARMHVDDFLVKQQYYQLDYHLLREKLLRLSDSYPNATISIYFEDLNTGAWVGVKEKEKYIPGSLLKVPALIATLKKVQEREISLDETVTILDEDLDSAFGTLSERGAGVSYSYEELLRYSAQQSDNTANNALRRQLVYGEFSSAMLGSGIPYTTDIKNNIMPVSAKDYANIFRSLYFSSFLRRSSSDYILSHLANTEFNSGIPAGVPLNIPVSHKIGVWKEGLYRHDCGVVYYPKKPYLLCVMTKGMASEQAFSIIKDVSSIVYSEVAVQRALQ